MFQDHVQALAHTAQVKSTLLKKNPLGYLLASILAGFYIGLGTCLIFTIQTMLGDFIGTKIVMGLAFSIGLCLVVLAGAELFTGNNLVLALAGLNKSLAWPQVFKLWLVCWLGNLLGSILCGLLFVGTGLAQGPTGEVFAQAALSKASLPFLPLLLRGVLCNVLVCLAVWGAGKIQDGAGKILYISLCIGTFVIAGYEHSVANMTLMTIGLRAQTSISLSLGPAIYNLLVVTLGNMLGGIGLVALPYYIISKDQ